MRAAAGAFPGWSRSSVADRREVLGRILEGVKRRKEELAAAISKEMGAPLALARTAQVPPLLALFTHTHARMNVRGLTLT